MPMAFSDFALDEGPECDRAWLPLKLPGLVGARIGDKAEQAYRRGDDARRG